MTRQILIRFGLVLLLVFGAAAVIAYSRHDHDRSANNTRRAQIEQAADPLTYAATEDFFPEGMWLGLTVTFAAVSLTGGGLAAVTATSTDRSND